ncbi:MAG: PfkB family carbohydrate kinase [Dehalococcoidia bacterium]
MVVGNVVEDRTPEGGWTAGGPSLYSALAAQALGADVTLVTCELASAGPVPFDRSALGGLRVIELPRLRGKAMPRYANTYDDEGNRTQLLVEQGDLLPASLVQDREPPRFRAPVDVLLYAPAFHELTSPPAAAIPARATAVALQGFLRDVRPTFEVWQHREPWAQVADWVDVADFAFLSEEDTAQPLALARHLAKQGVAAFLTRGYRGATLLSREDERELAALPANVTDPTGAGDCFCTAFLVRHAETGDIDEAARFALAAGALAVERPGLLGIPTRAEVEQRLAAVAA